MGKKKNGGGTATEAPATAPASNSSNGQRQRPAHEVRFGNIKGTIWLNHGDEGDWYSVVLSRSYKEGENWKTAHSFGLKDLLVVSMVAKTCWYWVSKEMQKGKVTSLPENGNGEPVAANGDSEEIPF